MFIGLGNCKLSSEIVSEGRVQAKRSSLGCTFFQKGLSSNMATRCQFENSNEIGVFSKLTNAYCLVALGGSENFYRFERAVLKIVTYNQFFGFRSSCERYVYALTDFGVLLLLVFCG